MHLSQHPGYLRPDSAGSSKAGLDPHDIAGGSTKITRPSLERFIPTGSPDIRFRGESDSPELRSATRKDSPDPFMTLLFSGWNPDLPDPSVLNHLYVTITYVGFCYLNFRYSIDVFFRCDPVRSVLHMVDTHR